MACACPEVNVGALLVIGAVIAASQLVVLTDSIHPPSPQ